MVCPDCGGAATDAGCSGCGRRFLEIDEMLFVLPEALAHIERDYDAVAGAAQSAEQL